MDSLTGGAKGGGLPTTGPTVMGPVGGGVNLPLPTVGQPTQPGGGWGQNIGPALQGIGALWGAYNQNQTNNANTDAQRAQLAMLNARQAQVTDYVNQFLQPGQNQYSQQMMQMLGIAPTQAAPATTQRMPGRAGVFSPPGGPAPGIAQQLGGSSQAAPYTGPMFQAPGQISMPGSQAFNAGQDGLLQMMRAGVQQQQNPQLNNALNDVMGTGNPYDMTNMFGALDAKTQNDYKQQLGNLRGSFGSFGERMGTAGQAQQGRLLNDFALNSNLQRQQLGMQSYGDAQSRRMQAMGLGAQLEGARNAGQLGAYQAQAGVGAQLGSMGLSQQQMGLGVQQANQSAQQAWNQFLMSGMGQANAMNQAQSGQNAQLLAILAGLQPGNAPVAQPNAMPGAIGDIGQLLMLLPYLRG